MVTGVIRYQCGTLVVEFPCKAYELATHLGSIGIHTPASELLVHGMEQIEVKLAANEPVGELILSKLRDNDTLSGVNLACQEVSRVCPFGYEEFWICCAKDHRRHTIVMHSINPLKPCRRARRRA